MKKYLIKITIFVFGFLLFLGTSTPTFATAPVHQFYENYSLDNGWTYSVDPNVSFSLTDTAFSRSAPQSMSFEHFDDYVGVDFYNTNNVDTTKYFRMIMYVNGGNDYDQNPVVYMKTAADDNMHGHSLYLDVEGRRILPNTWLKATLNFGSFHLLMNSKISLIRIESYNNLPSYTPPYYIDDVQFVCKGDANADNLMNLADYTIYSQEQTASCTGYTCRADFNQDGVVDTNDYNILMNVFGTTCN